jgi:hypothetical protein
LFPSGLEVPFVVQCNPQAPRPGAGQVSSPSYSPARDAVAAVPAAPRSPVGPVPWHRPRLLASSRSLATGGRGQGRKCGDAGSRDSSAVRGVATGGVASRAESGRGAWPQGAWRAELRAGEGRGHRGRGQQGNSWVMGASGRQRPWRPWPRPFLLFTVMAPWSPRQTAA